MIRSFRDKALRRHFETGRAVGLSITNAERVGRMLRALDAARRPEDLNVPGYILHALRGTKRWSVRASGNWRITFAWHGEDAVDADLEDYH